MMEMIKEVVKKRIKRTGTFRVVKIDNERLQRQVNTLELDNQRLQKHINVLEGENKKLKIQFNDLMKEKQNLLNERLEMVGFSLKASIRGVSPDAGKPGILKYILENIGKNAKILDVGFGSGVYSKLLRAFYYQNIDGVDVYGENIKEMGLDKIYDNIFIENILDFDFDYYDLILMGDVLEHIGLESAKKLLSGFIEGGRCDNIIVSIPYEYEQDEVYGK